MKIISVMLSHMGPKNNYKDKIPIVIYTVILIFTQAYPSLYS